MLFQVYDVLLIGTRSSNMSILNWTAKIIVESALPDCTLNGTGLCWPVEQELSTSYLRETPRRAVHLCEMCIGKKDYCRAV